MFPRGCDHALIVSAMLAMAFLALPTTSAAQTPYYPEIVDVVDETGWLTSIALEPDGTPHIAYMTYTDEVVKYAVKRGTCWETEVVENLTSRSKEISLALDADGTPHIVYDDPTNNRVRYAWKSGGIWSFEVVDAGSPSGTGDPSIALDALGRAHVAYYHLGEPWYALRIGANQWLREQVAPSRYGAQGGGNAIAVDDQNNPKIVYRDGTYDDLRYAEKIGGVWSDEMVDEGYAGKLQATISLDSQGEPHLAYADVATGMIRYATRVSGVWGWQEVTQGLGPFPVQVGQQAHPSIAMDIDDQPHVAYQKHQYGGLEYAVKQGGVWQYTLVDYGASDVGSYASLALDAGGGPHISYKASTTFGSTGDLRYNKLATSPVECTPPYSDRFVGTEIDLSLWDISSPLNASTVSQDGTLDVTSDGTGGSFSSMPGLSGPGAGVGSKCKLSGDFDIQVDFVDFVGSGTNHTQAFFNVYQDVDNQLQIKRIQGVSPLGIQSWYKLGGAPTGTGVASFSGASGSFRITRTGNLIATYYDAGSGWVVQLPPTPLFSGEVHVAMTLLAPGGYTASASFDNYLVNDGTVICPNGTVTGLASFTCAGASEPADGVQVDLLSGGSPVASTATDVDGGYVFEGVTLGTYTVTITPPAGQGVVLNDQTVSVTVPGETAVTDFELYCLVGEIAGSVSATCSGITEPAVGVEVNLLEGSIEIATTVTTGLGEYLFGDVPLGTYAVEVIPPSGYGANVDYEVVSLIEHGQSVIANFSLTCLLATIETLVTGECDGQTLPLQGVTVDLYSVDQTGEEAFLATGASDESGMVIFENVALGSYVVTILTPLGYLVDADAQDVELDQAGGLFSVAFATGCRDIAAAPRSMGYWKHQVNAHLRGKGHTHESLEEMLEYINLMVEHFNENVVNPVIVYVPDSENPSDQLLQLKQLLTVNKRGTHLDRAKRQLLALLLNVVSGKISQTEVISSDGATVSQAITYCDNLIDDPAGDFELAKDIADSVNNGEMVAADVIPLGTQTIAYRGGLITAPLEFTLGQNQPNPFAQATTVNFTLPSRAEYSLAIYNVAGRLVRSLSGSAGPGRTSVVWNGCDHSGSRVSSGLYFYRLEAAGQVARKTMVLVR